ncbi:MULTISPECIES: phosphotransferase enzyme family protein [unclassified Agrococcus]|uniref:phosphotransferase enzyme family protein n=1 Tax=unclassified Agrococcus TaxID=2615065 RepID=UPI003605DDDD
MSPREDRAPRAVRPGDLDRARVLAALADGYGLHVGDLRPVAGGWDGDAIVWAADDADGRLWSVKATVRDVRFGLEVAASLVRDGVEGVVAPRPARDGRLWMEADGVTLVVSPWVAGVDAVEVSADAVDWERLGRMLRRVHDLAPPSEVRARRKGIRRVDRAPHALLDEVDARLAAAGDDERLAPLRQRWPDALRRLRGLARAERALKRTRMPADRVTLHGDPHLGNVVVDVQGRPWLIDFDEAAVAPREVDLMLVELGVLFAMPLDESHRARFRDGYGTDAPIDEERVARFGCVRAIEDVASVVHHALDDTAPIGVDRLEALDGMLGPHGLVTLAERALERLGAVSG